MSDEDFEVVRRAWAAASRGDEDGMEREFHADLTAIPFGAALEGRAYQGRDSVMAWWRDEILETWEFFEVHPENFERVGNRLLVTGHWRARGLSSNIDLDIPASWIIEVRDGQIYYWHTFTDAEEARREIGLDQ